MSQANHATRPAPVQQPPSAPVVQDRGTQGVRRSGWNPAWGWGLLALCVLVAMAIAFLFGGNQDYS